jgi:hypothetical protein
VRINIRKRGGILPERRLISVCRRCGGQTPEKEAIQTRTVEGFGDLIEMGVACVHCGDWIHGRFDSPALDPHRQCVRDASAALDEIAANSLPRGRMAQARAGWGEPVEQCRTQFANGVEAAIATYYRAKKRMQREDQRFQEMWRGKLGVSRPAKGE